MPNGYDRAFIELTIACAAYHERFGGWPTAAHLDPFWVKALADLFDWEAFEELTRRLSLSTDSETRAAFVLIGSEGTLNYHDVSNYRELNEGGYMDAARAWLEVEPRERRKGEY